MALNVKVGLIGPFDMLKFKNMAKTREKAIEAAPAAEIVADYAINRNAKALHPDYLELTVDEVIDHGSAGAKTFVFKKKDGGALPYFRAGQYLSLKLELEGSTLTRPYSISSSPRQALDGRVAVTIRSNPAGFAADRLLSELRTGDTVISSAPEGHFYYEELRDAKQVVALAGGSGITPFLSMARAICEGSEDFSLTILFGSRDRAGILFADELKEITEACPKVRVVHILSDETAEGYEHGFITAELIRKYAPDGDYSVFLCGPEAMYRFVMPELETLELPRRMIRREMMGVTKRVAEQPGYPAVCKGKVFCGTIRQGAEEHTIAVAADEPILVALERAGIKAPSRCRSGECGWCRSKLVSGEVYCPAENEGRRHSDVVNGYIHPCSAFALSDIVLEVPGEYWR